MEHLLLPRGAVIAPNERAEYLAEPYDNGPFLTYPARSRFKHLYDALLPEQDIPQSTGVFDEKDKRELHIFLQTWLIFGLIHEVFGIQASADHFIVRDDNTGVSTISTARLGELAQQWVAEHRDLGESGIELLEHLINCILKTHQIVSVFHSRLDLDRTLVWVISSVGETLEELVLETLGNGTRSLPTTWRSFNTDLTAKQMIDHGWCASDVAKWRDNLLGFQAIYYVSKIEQPKIKDHSNCGGEVCIANQYDAQNRPTVHRCATKSCGSFAVDVEAVMDILGDGYIALLDITTNEDDTQRADVKLNKTSAATNGEDSWAGLNIDVVSSKNHDTYVALSHVWVDGLGNPSGNALPRCQLAYICKVIRDLARRNGHERIFLWLDTLCCPVQSMHHRILCITRMRQIYRDATYVLVLDAALAHYNSDDLHCVELTARLLFSAWMRRLWTLQEGSLAKNLWIQLEDKAVDVDALQVELGRLYKTDFIHVPLLEQLSASLKRLRETNNTLIADRPTDLMRVHAAVAFRSVSVATDEPICLCTLLDLAQETIVQAAEADRMKVFWQVFSEAKRLLSKHIVFFAGDRLTNPGFRWSPSTFLSAVQFYNLRNPKWTDQLATILPQGLKVQFPAFQITLPEILQDADRDHWDELFKEVPDFYYLRHSEKAWYFLIRVAAKPTSKGISPVSIILRSRSRHVVLLETELGDQPDGSAPRDVCSGLVASTPGDTSDEPLVHADETISVFKLPVHQTMIQEAAWKQSRDSLLQAAIRPLKKNANEEPVVSNDPMLRRLPNPAVLRLQHLAALALEDPSLAGCFQGTIEKRREAFMGNISLLLAERLAHVERVWGPSQIWYID